MALTEPPPKGWTNVGFPPRPCENHFVVARLLAAGWTVLLSVIAHGVTANPLVQVIGGRSTEHPAGVDRV
jgi:hypothetical protein